MKDSKYNYDLVREAAVDLLNTEGIITLKLVSRNLPVEISQNNLRAYLESLPNYKWLDEEKTVGLFGDDKTGNRAYSLAQRVLHALGEEREFEGAIPADDLYAAYCSRSVDYSGRSVRITQEELVIFVTAAFSTTIKVSHDGEGVWFVNPKAERQRVLNEAAMTDLLFALVSDQKKH